MNLSRIYQISWGGAKHTSVISKALVDASGQILNTPSSQLERVFLRLPTSFYPHDILSIIGGYFVVSGRAAETLAQYRLEPDIIKVPVDIEVKGRLVKTPYWWFSTLTEHSVLDREKSGCQILPGTDFISLVREWIVVESLLPPLDLFRGDKLRWMATEQLKSAIERNQLVNFEFEEVQVI